MIVPTKDLFKIAYGKYAIGAYNINNIEQTMGLMLDDHHELSLHRLSSLNHYQHLDLA